MANGFRKSNDVAFRPPFVETLPLNDDLLVVDHHSFPAEERL